MFCSNCGNSVNEKLKFCNSCGERIVKKEDDKEGTPGKMLNSILETIFFTAVVGFGILVGLVAVLLRGDVFPQIIAIIAVAYLATVFGICFVLLRQVPKLIDAKLAKGDSELPAAQLYAKTTAQLEEHREPVESVTSQTTRSLDKVVSERR
jgi:hypothetical protein